MDKKTVNSIQFRALIEKYQLNGEKTGWTYIRVSAALAAKLKADNKKSFRVKGKLDKVAFAALALIPVGEGNFILALKQDLRKKIGKQAGDQLVVYMEPDLKEPEIDKALLICLKDEPAAEKFFQTFSRGHQLYFSNWIKSAKTESTQSKRIAITVNALLNKQNFAEMLRAQKARRAAGEGHV